MIVETAKRTGSENEGGAQGGRKAHSCQAWQSSLELGMIDEQDA